MAESDNIDKNYLICKSNRSDKTVSKFELKNMYIAEGLSLPEISKKSGISLETVQRLALEDRWEELKKLHIVNGIAKIQNTQLNMANRLLDVENKFKALRIAQLEALLEKYAAYYSKHGHLFKTDPLTGEVLVNDENIPIKIRIPDVAKEIKDLKESVTLGEGMRQILDKLETITKAGTQIKSGECPDVIDIAEYSTLFEKSDRGELDE